MKYGKIMRSVVFVLCFGMSVCVYAYDDQFAQLSSTYQNESESALRNKVAGDAFLESNKKKAGVVTLPDGLQYKVIKNGTGVKPSDSDLVTVHYAGTLIDGTEFDSSYKRGQPVTFPLNGVIPGWTEALKLMKTGATWEIYIPASLAYGERGAPPVIGPNETLIFKVNLLSVKKG